MRFQFFQPILVFLGYNSLLLCQSLAAIRQNDRTRGSFLLPRKTTSISTLPAITVYTTVSALDPFQSTQTTFSSDTTNNIPTSATVVTVTVTDADVGPFMQNSGCSVASQELVYCTSLSHGFMTMPWASQTDCLCSFEDDFNGAVDSCAQYASIADTSLYSEITSWQDFCSTAAASSSTLGASSAASQPLSTNTGITSGATTQSVGSEPTGTPKSGGPVTGIDASLSP